MQKIRTADGHYVRSFCLVCFDEGKPWIGGELCEHFSLPLDYKYKQGTLEKPEQFPASESQ